VTRTTRPTERSLRIAFVHHGDQPTGELAAALAARGHGVRLARAVGDLEPRDPATGGRRVTLGLVAHLAASALRFGSRAVALRWNTPYAFDRHSERARRALIALAPPPDVILQRGALFAPGIPPRAPYVLLCDDTSAAAGRSELGAAWLAREAAVYAGAAALCASSRRAAASLVQDYRIPAGRVHVVGAGASVFPEAPARMDDGRTALLVAHDVERSGGSLAVEALRRVRRTHRKARLLVVAPGPPRLPLPQGSAALGPLAAAELPDVLALATVLVAPAAGAPCSGAVLDAMACGVPCIVARGSPLAEAVEDGETGLLVAPGDAGALADALGALLSEPARARAMGEAARRRVAASWRWELVAARVEAALLAAVARSGEVAA
jgi:glycosyltransferase involved in cell wall biosynthesis